MDPKPTEIRVKYNCKGRLRQMRLNAANVPIMFFSRVRRDEVWGGAKGTFLEDANWKALVDQGIALAPPEDLGPQDGGSGDCFCFEDQDGNPYCVCEA